MRPTNSDYRPDIDGLRALAVLAVVLFHAFPGRVPGGFVGVDVFFVISGYLITGIIARSAARGTFSYLTFYARRARRIFPALIVVLLATMALGWLLLLPDEFERLGWNTIASALFSANFAFWYESGYFDAASSTNPLLHLWSLGVEEQFYLFWPATLLAIWRLGRHRIVAIVGIALVSFALNIAIVRVNLSAGFFAPWTRIWELMIGALLAALSSRAEGEGPAFLHSPIARDLASLAGFVLIFTAILQFNQGLAFPGFYALVPTFGAVLLIAAGPSGRLNRWLLGNPVAVFVGLVSYPLYLWHWPLLVYTRLVMFAYSPPPSTTLVRAITVVIIAISFVAAYLTYRFIELPMRRSARLPSVAWRLSIALGLVAVAGAAIAWRPTPYRSGDARTMAAMQARADWATPSSLNAPFYATGSGAPEILFVGDSQAEQYYPAVQRAAGTMSPVPTVMFSTKGGCPFLAFVDEQGCASTYRRSLALASAPSVRRVIIAGGWQWYVEEEVFRPDRKAGDVSRSLRKLAHDVAALRAKGKEVVIIATHPNMPSADPALLAAPLRLPFLSLADHTMPFASFSLSEFRPTSARIDAQLAAIARETGARLISPADYACTGGVCPAMDETGAPLRMDGGHFRPFAIARYFTYVPSLVAP